MGWREANALSGREGGVLGDEVYADKRVQDPLKGQ